MQSHTADANFDETVMVEHTLQGDLEAFNQLVLAHQDSAYRVAYRMMGERMSAEDVVQDAFLTAYRKLNAFRFGSFRAWLLRIVTNTCYDEIRRQKRRSVVPLYPLDEHSEEVESPIWLEDPGETPEEAAMLMELNHAIQKSLGTLEADFRIVVVLIDVMAMSYAEAAEVLGIPLGTLKSRLRRARLKLRFSLKKAAI